MATLSSFIATPRNSQTYFLSGSSLKPMDRCFLKISTNECVPGSSLRGRATCNQTLVIRASGDGGRSSSGSIFVGGFVLGGLIVGALGCLYAPQISRALAGADSKDLMRKLPKFVYDEDRALQKTRKALTEKIAELNSAIDGVSAKSRPDENQNEAEVNSEEIGASHQSAMRTGEGREAGWRMGRSFVFVLRRATQCRGRNEFPKKVNEIEGWGEAVIDPEF
ncbi:hypothetical protein VNO78_08583 [Psophocarpus tetragonolobus]|uniref:Uncharacterized protein n=1 Tax=Psophocarpus tetragonolobus TaxID=3891 RepID=A0AAN9T5Z1_PSOTE